MKRFLWALLLAPLPALAANVTATTGWVCISAAEPNGGFGSATIDSGSNRKLVLVTSQENNTAPAPTVTVGGQNPSETIGPFQAEPGSSPDQWHYMWLWDESEIAAMSGSTFAYSDATTSTGKFFCYGTVEDTDQAALTAYDDTDENASSNQLVLTTTSNVGDLVLVTSISDGTGGDHTWTGITEIHESDSSNDMAFAVGNADSVTIDYAITNEVSAAGIVMPDAAAGAPDWDTPPAIASQTDTAYTISYDANADADNIFCGLFAKDASTPTAANIAAGTGDRALATEATTGSSDTIVLTAPESPPWYIGDIYCVLREGASTYTTVAAGDLLDEVLDIPSGKQRATLTSVHATSPYDGLSVASGDTCTIDLLTDPGAYAITDEVDGTVSYAAGGDTSRQLIDSYCYDVSSPQNRVFILVYNNQAPQPIGAAFFADDLFRIGVNPSVDLSADSVDAELDDIDFAVVSGALPDDWVLNGETGVISDGVPGDCDIYDFDIRMTDAYGATTDVPNTVIIGDLVPDPAGMTPAEFIAALAADFCVP